MHPRFFLLALAALYFATFLAADGLRFDPVKDELHFHESALAFARPFGVEALRSYPEVVTPLALVTWGMLERATGDGLWSGRLLNLALSSALVCLVAFARPRLWPRGALAAVGFLVFPYTLPLSVHLYTDIMAATLAGLGTWALLRNRPVMTFFGFAAAIGTRQYLVQIAAAFAIRDALAWWRGGGEHWKTALSAGAAAASLGAWVLFFGGLAPRPGLEVWIPRYAAPMLEASSFVVHHGLYYLTGLGVYFVLVEWLLFRLPPPWRGLSPPRALILAALLGAFFLLDPPFLTPSHPGGPIGRISRILLPSPAWDAVRVSIYYLLALLAIVRFSRRLDAAFWVVVFGVALAMKQQLPWEKYLLPTLAALWMLRSAGELLPYGVGDRTDAASKSFTKQSSPTARFST
jgi:hypothetical protein